MSATHCRLVLSDYAINVGFRFCRCIYHNIQIIQ